MGIISAAMAAAGNSGVESMNQNIEQMNRQELMDKQAALNSDSDQRRAELEVWKANAIEQLKNAPVSRLQEIIGKQATEQVPVEAKPVTSLNGRDPNSEFNKGGSENADGMGLDPSKTPDLIARVNAMPDSDPNKQAILEQLSRQAATQKQENQDAVAGQTRERTPEEILEASLNHAKLHDPQAYAAAVASGLVQPKLTKVGPNETLVDNKGKAVFSNTAGADAEAIKQDRADARTQMQIDAAERRQRAYLDAMIAKNEIDPETLEVNAAMIANYELAAPTGFAASKPVAQKMLQRAKEINPNFDAKNYKVIQNLDDKFKSGKQGDQVRSVNAAMEHLDLYKQLAEAQNAKDIPMFNRIAAKFAQETGSAIPTNLNVAASIVGPEIAKVMVPGGGGVHERDEYVKKFSVGNSPEQALGVADTYLGLMAGQLRGFARQYSNVAGADPSVRMEKFRNFLSPEANELLDRHGGVASSPIKAPTDYGKPKPAAQQGGVKFLGFE